MTSRTLMGLAVMMAVACPAWAQPEAKVDVTRGPDHMTATGTATTTAKIVKIVPVTRTVTLKTDKGKEMDVVVGEEARNFDQLHLGDVVTVEYKEALTLSLKKGSGPLARHERVISDRSVPGAKPGGTMGREVTVTADVVAVNADARTVTVKGPKGHTVDLMVEDPDRLAKIKKGDRIEAVYTEATAISIRPEAGK
ncbi:hypothetical protein SAMN04488595_10312 [Ralstonia sp. 25mfcol4.1]|uniref:hypothetical protein n=1 Tax=Ralstonia sp. 25mfcol4.1 TaxID=1761899 RepID=UPI0008897219|nr:hypothetical protein [Ralstonia sp. 25mfcol4.1]SDO90985.1 hypothetical protein SAMN04488595_10312 [Ralstonia sp. 25mfcol4.1]